MTLEQICLHVYDNFVRRRERLEQFDFARLFSALGDRTRLRLLNLLAGREICVCHLVDVLGESQSKISRHLAYLRRAGVVKARREGKWMHYSLVMPGDKAAAEVMESVLEGLGASEELKRDLRELEVACCG